MIILQRTDIEETTLSSEISDTRLDLVAQLVERWTSKPKVAGSIPTVVSRFLPCLVWIHNQEHIL